MNNGQQIQPLDSRQFLRRTRGFLTDDVVLGLVKKEYRTYMAWSADKHTDKGSRRTNPIENFEKWIKKLFDELMDDPTGSGTPIARGLIAHFARSLGCGVYANEPVTPDGETIEEELLDDYPALIRLHGAIRSGRDIEQVELLSSQLKREIEETVEQYRRTI